MSYRTFLSLSIAPFLGVSALAAGTNPNIIVFLVDDMGWQDTSVPFAQDKDGNPVQSELNRRYKTPNMERLAKMGVKFTRAYACPVSSPSRISLMTGANAARHGVTNWTDNVRSDNNTDNTPRLGYTPSDWNINGMAPAAGTPQQAGAGTKTDRTFTATPLAQILREHGYYTIHVGKAHLGTPQTAASNPLNLGFDVNIAGSAIGGPATYIASGNKQEDGGYLYGAGGGNTVYGLSKWNTDACYLNEAITRASLEQIDIAKTQNKPFFLYLSHYAVHAPYAAASALDSRFTEPSSQYYIADYAALTGQQKVYATMISSMDKSLGDVLDKIEKDPSLAENTVIMFMADNGGHESNKNTPAQAGKGSCWEGGIHEPMMVYTPEMKQGKRLASLAGTSNKSPVIIEDFFPSILEMAGVQNPVTAQKIDGKSFLQALYTGETQNMERGLVFHYPNGWGEYGGNARIGDPASAIVKGDYKYIYLYKSKEHFLYNLKDDIGEETNLAQANPEKLEELKRELSTALIERNAPMLFQNAAKTSYVPYPDGTVYTVPQTPDCDLRGFLDFTGNKGRGSALVSPFPPGVGITDPESVKIALNSGKVLSAEISYSGTVKATGPGGQFGAMSELIQASAVRAFLGTDLNDTNRAIWGDGITLENDQAKVVVELSELIPNHRYRIKALDMRKNSWYGDSGNAAAKFSLSKEIDLRKVGHNGVYANATAGNPTVTWTGSEFTAVHTTNDKSTNTPLSCCYIWEFIAPQDGNVQFEAAGKCSLCALCIEEIENPESNTIPNEVAIIDSKKRYTTWANEAARFPSEATAEDKKLDSAPAKDGIVNLEKFVFDSTGNAKPASANGAYGTAGLCESNGDYYLEVTFPYNPDAETVAISAEIVDETGTWKAAGEHVSLERNASKKELKAKLLTPTKSQEKQALRLIGELGGSQFKTAAYGYKQINFPGRGNYQFELQVHKPHLLRKEFSISVNEDYAEILDRELLGKIDLEKAYVFEILETIDGKNLSTPILVNQSRGNGASEIVNGDSSLQLKNQKLIKLLSGKTSAKLRIRDAMTVEDVTGTPEESGLTAGSFRTADLLKFYITEENIWSIYLDKNNKWNAAALNGICIKPEACPLNYQRFISLTRKTSAPLTYLLCGEVLTEAQVLPGAQGTKEFTHGLLFSSSEAHSFSSEKNIIGTKLDN